MYKKTITAVLFLIFAVATYSFAQKEEKPLNLSLEDCILQALKNNLGIAIEVLTPELSDLSVRLAKDIFLPQVSLSFDKRSTNSASFSFLESAGDVISDRNNYSFQYSQQIPTGGNVSISLTGYKSETNQRLTTINPRFGNTLSLNLNQPLLRNFGFKNARRNIIIAQNNLDISDNNFKQSLHNIIYDVEDAYWNLVYNVELLKVRQQSLKLARDLLEKNRRSVEVGTMAPIEILNAQSTVATREADILQQDALVKNAEDLLKAILNLSREEAETTKIIPSDTPTYEEREANLDEALVTAMQYRPDLEATRIDLKNREINLKYAKNQLLPDLSLSASYWSPGVSGTQILFDPLNPFGDPIGEVPGGAGDALKDVFGFKYQNWSLGLSLSIPVDTIFSKASLAQAKVNLQQSLLRLKNQEQNLYLEIKTNVRAVQTNYKRVQAYKLARELQQRNLAAEEEKLKVGLTTNYFVLQYQRDLADSQVSELKATIDYNLSLARLSRSLGTTLKEKNIRIAELYGR